MIGRPEQRLACAVLAKAVEDLALLSAPEEAHRREGEEAAAFLTGGPMLDFWCSLAGYDHEPAAERAKRLIEQGGRGGLHLTNRHSPEPLDHNKF